MQKNHIMKNPLWSRRKDEKDYKTQELKHSILIRSDPKCFETVKVLH